MGCSPHSAGHGLGEPRLEKLKASFGKAKNMLNKMPGEKEFVSEDEVAKFSRELAEEIAKHGEHESGDTAK